MIGDLYWRAVLAAKHRTGDALMWLIDRAAGVEPWPWQRRHRIAGFVHPGEHVYADSGRLWLRVEGREPVDITDDWDQPADEDQP